MFVVLDELAHALHGRDCQVIPAVVHVADARVLQPVVDDADAFIADLTVGDTDPGERRQVTSRELEEVLADDWWHLVLGEANSLDRLLFQRSNDDLED